QLRLVVQLTADFQLMNYAVAQWQDMVPIGYVTRDLTRHAFSEQDRDSPEYRRLAEFPRIKYERTNDERNLVTANFHMAVAKEIGKRLRLSFNVFNFLDYQPRYYRERAVSVVAPN